MKDNLIHKKIGLLTIIEYHNEDKMVCQCKCGKKLIIPIKDIKDKRVKYSCGCDVTRKQLPNLYKLYSRFTQEEKDNWNGWDDFILWSKSLRYNEYFSNRKPNRKLPYSKDNLQFGIFINSQFFTIKELNNKGYYYNERKGKLVTSTKDKNQIVDYDTFTKQINKTSSKHNKISQKQFDIFLNKNKIKS